MQSGYVKSAYKNVASSGKTARTKIISLSNGDLFRLFHVEFQISEALDPSEFSGISLHNQDSSDLGYQFFRDEVYSSHVGGQTFRTAAFIDCIKIPSNGVDTVCTGDGIYFTGLGVGINFISLTYQIGSQA